MVHFLFAALFVFFSLASHLHGIHGQSQAGFLSLDCGLPEKENYDAPNTALRYISDAPYIDSGAGKTFTLKSNDKSLDPYFLRVRAFPTGVRNCYNISTKQGTKYLIRSRFYYGNYDGLHILPEFDLYLNVNKCSTVQITNETDYVDKEVIFTPWLSYITICLVNTGNGIPFVSAIELRPLHNETYPLDTTTPIACRVRYDYCSTTGKIVRYPDDVYDRIWKPNSIFVWTGVSTNLTVDKNANYNKGYPPPIVMSTACLPKNPSDPIMIYFRDPGHSRGSYIFMHFAEIVKLGPEDKRVFGVAINTSIIKLNIIPEYLSTTTVYNPMPYPGYNDLTIIKQEDSTLRPIINAIESFQVVDLDNFPTYERNVKAMTEIKSRYGVKRNWQGDPCSPQGFAWEGLKCSGPSNAQLVITGLDLSSAGMYGSMPEVIQSLTSLASLNLSNNSLTGNIPLFLSTMSSLSVIDLSNNNFDGTIPDGLYIRSKDGSLDLRIGGNLDLCASLRCAKKKSMVVPVVGAAVGFTVLVAVTTLIIIFLRKKKATEDSTDEGLSTIYLDKASYSFSELLQITSNFNKIIGEGRFGTVYQGSITGVAVAVKMLKISSNKVFHDFHDEVNLLLQIHHKNLISLLGYCDDPYQLGLIYEYMDRGNLKDIILGENFYPDSEVLSWETRLQISLDAAKGLEYLHCGCDQKIVHKDLNTTNILLNKSYEAKIADFGFSRSSSTQSSSQFVSTAGAGTPGFIDPEYIQTNVFTEKSDVYSFGAVLLEIVTALPVINMAEYDHLKTWAASRLEIGGITQIVDPRLNEDYAAVSVLKVVELALSCVSVPSSERPSMSEAVIELNRFLEAEKARKVSFLSELGNENNTTTFFTAQQDAVQ